MVDFQERDGRRLPESNGGGADGGDDGGVAEIDAVREQLEQRPEHAMTITGGEDDATTQGGDEGEGDQDHDDHAADDHHDHDLEEMGAAVVTVSSSRTLADDPSGDHVVEALVDAGHDVVTRELIPDEYDDIQHTVDTLVRRGDVDIVVTTGGTGVTPDDRTIEAVRPLFEKELPGFGELFRLLSYEEIGTRIVATRATAGIIDGAPVFCLPGSRNAVTLGVEELVVPEAPHLAGLAERETEHRLHGHEHEEV